jgi:hypothetical protein
LVKYADLKSQSIVRVWLGRAEIWAEVSRHNRERKAGIQPLYGRQQWRPYQQARIVRRHVHESASMLVSDESIFDSAIAPRKPNAVPTLTRAAPSRNTNRGTCALRAPSAASALKR